MTAPAVKPTWLHAYILDPLERGGSTFVQVLVTLLLPYAAAGQVVSLPWVSVLDRAGFAGLASIAASVLTFWVPELGVGWDFVIRLVRTFVATFVGIAFAANVAPSLIHAPWQQALAAAIPATFYALLKGLGAFAAPWSHGASLLPNSAALYQHGAYVVHSMGDDPNADAHPDDVAYAALDSAKASTPPQPVTAAEAAVADPSLLGEAGKHEAQG